MKWVQLLNIGNYMSFNVFTTTAKAIKYSEMAPYMFWVSPVTYELCVLDFSLDFSFDFTRFTFMKLELKKKRKWKEILDRTDNRKAQLNYTKYKRKLAL